MRYPVSGSGYGFQYRNAGTIRNSRSGGLGFGRDSRESQKYGLNFNANIAFSRSRIMWIWPGWKPIRRSRVWNNKHDPTTMPYWAAL